MKKRVYVLAAIALLVGFFSMLVLISPASAASQKEVSLSSLDNMCGDYEVSRTLWHGVVPVTATINGSYCTDGNHVWENGWGPDCTYSTVYGTPSTTWCGVYNNGGSFMEPGVNFNMTIPYGGGTYSCYLRTHFNQYGTITDTWGGC